MAAISSLACSLAKRIGKGEAVERHFCCHRLLRFHFAAGDERAAARRVSAFAPNGASAASASAISASSRARAAAAPSAATSVALPAAASLPAALPMVGCRLRRRAGRRRSGTPGRSPRHSGRCRRVRRVGLAEDRAGAAGEADQRAGLHRLQGRDSRFRQGALVGEAAFGGEIEHLPAGHAAKAGRARQFRHQRDAHRRHRDAPQARENVEGDGEQRVAGEDRGRLVERLVHGRPAAAQVVVVHGGQIVMHQRVTVQAFERGAGQQRAARARRRTARRSRPAGTAAAVCRRRARHGAWRRAGVAAARSRPARLGAEQAVEQRLGVGRDRGQPGQSRRGERLPWRPLLALLAAADRNSRFGWANVAAMYRPDQRPGKRLSVAYDILRLPHGWRGRCAVGFAVLLLLLLPYVAHAALCRGRSGLDRDAVAPHDRRAGRAPICAAGAHFAGAVAGGDHRRGWPLLQPSRRGLPEIRDAIADADDLDDLRGGSTITQQVAKNLFLWPGRSFVRKALELPLALWIDLVLPKRRVLEIYLNIAEWGPNGEFGVEAGSRRAFGKSARDLVPHQAAMLAAVLPKPGEPRCACARARPAPAGGALCRPLRGARPRRPIASAKKRFAFAQAFAPSLGASHPL